MIFSEKVKERFWSKVEKNGPIPEYNPSLGECWIWQGKPHSGYGQLWIDETIRDMKAHRVSLLIQGVEIPKWMFVDHMCRVKICVNPAHLRVVTPRVNAMENNDGPWVANAKKTHCPQGHEYTKENTIISVGKRNCRICSLKRTRDRYNRIKANVKI